MTEIIKKCYKRVLPKSPVNAGFDSVFISKENLPKRIRLDICNLCQLDCEKCWMRLKENEIKEKYGGFGYVDFSTFKKFIYENDFIEEIELSLGGEIFLNPDLDKIIEYCYKKGIKLTANNGVNLNYLAEGMAETLVKYGFDSIKASIDGATPETYAIYRRKGDLNKVIENIKEINRYKKIYNSSKPEMVWKFLLFGHNEHEIGAAKKLAAELDMEIIFELNAFPEYSPIKDRAKVLEETGLKTLDSNLEYFYQDYEADNSKWFFCTDIFNSPCINYNGDIFGCCCIPNKGFGANAFKDGYFRAFNCLSLLKARAMLINPCFKSDDIPCSKCFVFDFLKQNQIQLNSKIKNDKNVLHLIKNCLIKK